MKYIIDHGYNDNVIITLHGTGGSADDLFDVARFIDPNATLIGFEGTVMANGMRRYFERYANGDFNFESLALASKDLFDSIEMTVDKYNLKDKKITLMGYSNGANLSIDFFKEFENTRISKAILFHPSSITPLKNLKTQKQTRIFMTSGAQDSYISPQEFEAIKKDMLNHCQEVKTFTHPFGHQMIQEEIEWAKMFYYDEKSEALNE